MNLLSTSEVAGILRIYAGALLVINATPSWFSAHGYPVQAWIAVLALSLFVLHCQLHLAPRFLPQHPRLYLALAAAFSLLCAYSFFRAFSFLPMGGV
jgi:uncharacterized Zn-finger protein